MSALYDKGREGILDRSIDWPGGTVKAVLIDSADYTVNLATHANLSDIPSGARLATTVALTGKTSTGGVADADDTSFLSVPNTGDTGEIVVLYQDSGSPATSRLIAYVDTFASGMPVTPNGGDIALAWASGANKIFKL